MQQLVRVSLNRNSYTAALTYVDSKQLLNFAADQGLFGISFDGVKDYLSVLNAICVRYFDYDASLFPNLQVGENC